MEQLLERCEYPGCPRMATVRVAWESVVDGADAAIRLCPRDAGDWCTVLERAEDVTSWRADQLTRQTA